MNNGMPSTPSLSFLPSSSCLLTLENVLNDLVASPFSLQDFEAYLNQTYCTENLAFYRAVVNYRKLCQFYFGAVSLSGKNSNNNHNDNDDNENACILVNDQPFTFHHHQYHQLDKKHQVYFDHLIYEFDTIMHRFIHDDAVQEINIPAEIKQQLLLHYHHHRHYHPSLLEPVCISILELLRISAFIPFTTDPSRLVHYPFHHANHDQEQQQQQQRDYHFPVSSSASCTLTSKDIALSASASSPPSASPASSFSLSALASTASTPMSFTASAPPQVERPRPASTLDRPLSRPSMSYRSSSHPDYMPPPLSSLTIKSCSGTIQHVPSSPLPPWKPRRLKSSPALNTPISLQSSSSSVSSPTACLEPALTATAIPGPSPLSSSVSSCSGSSSNSNTSSSNFSFRTMTPLLPPSLSSISYRSSFVKKDKKEHTNQEYLTAEQEQGDVIIDHDDDDNDDGTLRPRTRSVMEKENADTPFFKKLTFFRRSHAPSSSSSSSSSSSTSRTLGWRQINIPDASIFSQPGRPPHHRQGSHHRYLYHHHPHQFERFHFQSCPIPTLCTSDNITTDSSSSSPPTKAAKIIAAPESTPFKQLST